MTNRAEDVRVAYPLIQAERGGSTPTSALQLHFAPIAAKTAQQLNALWHSRLPIFITGCCLNSIISYGAEGNGLYYAIAIWTNPAAPALPQQAWLELRRMAVSGDAPKNTASRMLGFMARDIKRRFPKVKRLVSYQDCEVHLGTIYKAAGWQATVSYRGGRPNLNNAIGKKQRWELILRP